jgi:ceramide glucosyltransferase
MLVLTVVLAVLTVASWGFYLAQAIATWRFFKANVVVHSEPSPRVSILVPICGLDAGAWENWSSLCEQDYPDYEVLFGVMDEGDEAVPLLRSLVAEYGDRARLFVGLPPLGPNHKDSNVGHLLREARSDWFIFSDSDISVRPDYIRTVMGPLWHGGFGMVTCAYIARNPKFFGAAIASLGRCCDFIPSILIARLMDGGVKLGIGVTMAMSRQVLENAGGIVYNRIGSDYNLGMRVVRSGQKVALSRYVLESDTGDESWRSVYERELRWSRTIRFNRGAIYYAQGICFGTVYGLVLMGVSGFAAWAIGLFAVTLGLRYGQALLAARLMGATGLVRRWFGLILVRDGLSFWVWVMGCGGRRIVWRGRRLRVQGDGVISEV